MKIIKSITISFLALSLTGCASYKYQKTEAPEGKTGYVVAREDRVIPEYTIGPDNSYPGLQLAEARFKRRKDMVEYYYKKMDLIRNRFNDGVKTYGYLFIGIATSVFRLPFAATSDYRYEHDPAYKARMDKIYAEQEAAEAARVAQLKIALNDYMQREFALEKKYPP